MSIEDTLKERQRTHGDFRDHAEYTQQIKLVMHYSPQWRDCTLSYTAREALDMIAHKMGRILSGDPMVVDHWHDIAGYATLVEKELTNDTHGYTGTH